MSTNSQPLLSKTFLLFFTIAIVGSSVLLSYLILANVCSQLIANSIYYYKETMRQQFTTP